MARGMAGVLIAVAVVAALWFATRREAAVECTVCMEYEGRAACRTAAAPKRDDALRGAATTACAVLASGVTRGLDCDRTPPRSIECSE
jgi:hypothetical protein